jgi:alkaline phosphatase D
MKFPFLLSAVVSVCSSVALAQETPAVSTIAFGSCIRQTKPVPAFDAVNAIKPDVFVFLGDNIYGDTTDMDVMRAKWKQLGDMPGFQTLKSQTKLLYIWDDHDFGENDAGKEYTKKDESKRVMLEFFGAGENDPRLARAGLYDSQTFGPEGQRVQFILLDTRTFRDALELDASEAPRKRYKPTADETKTILGAEQWTWLEAELKKPADVRIIASSIQLLPSQHKFELWANFPHELKRIRTLLDAASGTSIVITGDRHFGEISLATDTAKPLVDVTSSSMNSAGWGNRNEPNRYRVEGSFTGNNNFGLIRIDWAGKSFTASLIDEAGKMQSELKRPFNP